VTSPQDRKALALDEAEDGIELAMGKILTTGALLWLDRLYDRAYADAVAAGEAGEPVMRRRRRRGRAWFLALEGLLLASCWAVIAIAGTASGHLGGVPALMPWAAGAVAAATIAITLWQLWQQRRRTARCQCSGWPHQWCCPRSRHFQAP